MKRKQKIDIFQFHPLLTHSRVENALDKLPMPPTLHDILVHDNEYSARVYVGLEMEQEGLYYALNFVFMGLATVTDMFLYDGSLYGGECIEVWLQSVYTPNPARP